MNGLPEYDRAVLTNLNNELGEATDKASFWLGRVPATATELRLRINRLLDDTAPEPRDAQEPGATPADPS